MDLDENGYGPSDQVSETESPAPAVQDVPLLDTLAITEDRSVATEKARDLLPLSSFIKWPTQKAISHCVWSPEEPGPVLIGGTNCLRLYAVKSDQSAEAMFRDIDIPGVLEFDVEALCWTGRNEAVASISDRNASDDDQVAQIIHIWDWGIEVDVLNSVSGVVFSLQYNPSSQLMLALSGGSLTTITIYKIGDGLPKPLCSKELPDNNLYDASWMTRTKFIACGTNILQIYEFTTSERGTFEIRLLQTHDMRKQWFRIKYDPVCEIAALVDEDMRVLRQYGVATEDTRTQAFTDSVITDFAFQPIPNPDTYDPTTSPRLLATSTDDGIVRLWDVLNPFTCVHKLSVPGYADAVTMKQISFSPDGFFLAGCGFDTVAVWKPEEGGQPRALWRCTDTEQWRSVPAEDADDDDMELDWVHALGWDADGHRLVFSLQDQVCVSPTSPPVILR
jgi:transducin (beta)-like 1